jgi:hypothetical protein
MEGLTLRVRWPMAIASFSNYLSHASWFVIIPVASYISAGAAVVPMAWAQRPKDIRKALITLDQIP